MRLVDCILGMHKLLFQHGNNLHRFRFGELFHKINRFGGVFTRFSNQSSDPVLIDSARIARDCVRLVLFYLAVCDDRQQSTQNYQIRLPLWLTFYPLLSPCPPYGIWDGVNWYV